MNTRDGKAVEALSRLDAHRLRHDYNYCGVALMKADETTKSEIFSILAEECPPLMAREIAWEIYESSQYPEQQYGNMGTYLLYKAISDLIYEDSIHWLFKFYRVTRINDATAKCVAACIYERLKASKEFAECFSNDDKHIPYFGDDFFTLLEKHIITRGNDIRLLTMCEETRKFPINLNLAREELQNKYGFGDPLTVDELDAISIAMFLADDNAFFRQLDVVEAALKAKAGERLDAATNMLDGYEEGKVYKHHKLLFSTLYELIRQSGFPGYAKIYGELDSEDFLNIVNTGYPFKDIGKRGKNHGEESHLLQWVCIGLEYLQRGNQFLQQHPSLTLRWLGQPENEDFWFHTFEISDGSLDFLPYNICRSVMQLHEYLLSAQSQQRYPVLHQLITGRSHKEHSYTAPANLKKTFSLHHFFNHDGPSSQVLVKGQQCVRSLK